METAANDVEDIANNVLGKYPLLDVFASDTQQRFNTYTQTECLISFYNIKSTKFRMLLPAILDSGVYPILALRWGLEFERNLGWKDKIWKPFFEEISAFSFWHVKVFHVTSPYKKILNCQKLLFRCLCKNFPPVSVHHWSLRLQMSSSLLLTRHLVQKGSGIGRPVRNKPCTELQLGYGPMVWKSLQPLRLWKQQCGNLENFQHDVFWNWFNY